MRHSEFKIGMEFVCDDKVYRCTDVGSRIVAAIHIGPTIEVTQCAYDEHDRPWYKRMTLTTKEAEAERWFRGPPYAVFERLFDEDELGVCHIEPEGDY